MTENREFDPFASVVPSTETATATEPANTSSSAVPANDEERLPKHTYMTAVGTDAESPSPIQLVHVVVRDGEAYAQFRSNNTGALFESKLSDFRYVPPPKE